MIIPSRQVEQRPQVKGIVALSAVVFVKQLADVMAVQETAIH